MGPGVYFAPTLAGKRCILNLQESTSASGINILYQCSNVNSSFRPPIGSHGLFFAPRENNLLSKTLFKSQIGEGMGEIEQKLAFWDYFALQRGGQFTRTA